MNAFTQTAQLLSPDDRYTLEVLAVDFLDWSFRMESVCCGCRLRFDPVLTLPFEEPLLAITA